MSEETNGSMDVELVFIIGCQRSGTTWLQILLEKHPAIASTQETYLFSGYMAKMYERWEYESERKLKSPVGISDLINEEEFLGFCREMCDFILCRIREKKPGASVILEKTPNNALFIGLIRRLYPNAKFIHLLRDPRAVVNSIMAAGKSWGKHWAPSSPVNASLIWRNVLTAVDQNLSKDDDLTKLVRYEDLKSETVGELSRLFEWLGLDTNDGKLKSYIEEASPDVLRQKGSDLIPVKLESKSIFVRNATTDSWKTELRRGELKIIEFINWELMDKYGYRPLMPKRSFPPLRVIIYKCLDEVIKIFNYRSKRFIKKL